MNPVFRKDILSLLRLKRIAAVVIAFVALLGVLLLATWPQQGLVSLAASREDNLLLGLIVGQLLVLVLAVPGVASVQLTEEKEGGTLEMLYSTRLSPLSIIAGKLGSAIGFPLLLLLCGLPFVALLNFRGDVDQAGLLLSYAVLIVAAAMLALLSLAVSAMCRFTATALVAGYMLALVVCGGVIVPALIVLDVADPTTATALHVLRSFSPVSAILSILRPDFNDVGGMQRGLPPAWQIFFGFAALAIIVSVIIVVRSLSRPPADADRVETITQGGGSLSRRMLVLIDSQKQRKPIGGLNPLMAKERRTNQLRSGKWMIRIFYGATVLGLGLSLLALLGGSEHENVLSYVAAVIASLQFALLGLVTPSLASPVISSEIESGTFEMLRMTRLGGGKIFWGKFIPAFLPGLLPIIAILPAWGVVSVVNPEYIGFTLHLLPVTVLCLVLCSTVAMASSALSPSSARATVVAYLIVAVLLIVPMLAWWLAGPLLAAPLAAKIAMISPLAIALDARPGVAMPLTRDLFNVHLIVIGAISLLALIVARVRLWQLMRQG